MLLNNIIMYILKNITNRSVIEWNTIRRQVELDHLASIPEIKVVEALKLYLDGVWCGPIEAKRLWNNVLLSIKELDENNSKFIESNKGYLRAKN